MFRLKSFLLNGLTKFGNSDLNKIYWNLRAKDIHERWGAGQTDFPVLRNILQTKKPEKILDFGCGSGRCFPLYLELNIPEVVGQDVSSQTIHLCKKRFPSIPYTLLTSGIEQLNYPENYFDLIVSTRSLSAVLPQTIKSTIKCLASMGRYIYLNEMTDSDYIGHSSYWFKHDYSDLMRQNDFQLELQGTIPIEENGKQIVQTYFLYKKIK